MVFTSYRRTDSAAFAGRIADFFAYKHPDIPSSSTWLRFEPGGDFDKAITAKLHASAVVLANIGETWLDCGDSLGRRRLDDPEDFLRTERAMALALESRVIPVLLDNPNMSPATRLPEDLKPLAKRNAQYIRGVAFQRDVESLGQFVHKLIAALHNKPVPAPIDPVNVPGPAIHSELKQAFVEFRDLQAPAS